MSNILKGTNSTVPGFNSLDVDLDKLFACLQACQHAGVTYGLGSKAPESHGPYVFTYPPNFSRIDCSGWVRYALYHATGGGLLIVDGSANQNDQFGTFGFKHYGPDSAHSYYQSVMNNKDEYLRICFCRASSSEPIGHVWLGYNAYSLESSGGVGPHSRPLETPVLERIITDVYVLGHFPN